MLKSPLENIFKKGLDKCLKVCYTIPRDSIVIFQVQLFSKKSRKFHIEKNHAIYMQVQAVFQTLGLVSTWRGVLHVDLYLTYYVS